MLPRLSLADSHARPCATQPVFMSRATTQPTPPPTTHPPTNPPTHTIPHPPGPPTATQGPPSHSSPTPLPHFTSQGRALRTPFAPASVTPVTAACPAYSRYCSEYALYCPCRRRAARAIPSSPPPRAGPLRPTCPTRRSCWPPRETARRRRPRSRRCGSPRDGTGCCSPWF